MGGGVIRFVAIAAIAVILAGCRAVPGASEAIPPPTSAATTAGDASPIPLPTVVPFAEKHPNAFDENGCLRLGPNPSDVDCGLAPGMPGQVEPSPHPDDSKHLLGFDGPFYTAFPSGTEVTLLDESVAEGQGDTWSATGLVRNELTSPIGPITVTATLLDAAGAEVGVATASTLLPVIRPGEPAPFAVESDVATATVETVEWALTDSEPTSDPDARAMETTLYWSQPYGDRERLDDFFPADPVEPPYPFTLVGGVGNYSGSEIHSPFVVFGWLDSDGRLVFVGTSPIRHFTVSAEPVDVLPPDGQSGFVIQVGDPVFGPMMSADDGGLILWSSGE